MVTQVAPEIWKRLLEMRHVSVRIKGQHYLLGGRQEAGHVNGFNGMHVRIRFFDGREVESNDLWCQGEIPAEYRADLPDNAEFIL